MKNLNTLKFCIDFVGGMNRVTSLHDDLNYVRERAMTYRGINTDEIDSEAGMYFESIVTMSSAMEYIIKGIGEFEPIQCEVSVVPYEQASLGMVGFAIIHEKMAGSMRDYTISLPIRVDLSYSNYEMVGNTAGAYSIDITPVADREFVASDGITRIIPDMVAMIGSGYSYQMYENPSESINWCGDRDFTYVVKKFPNGSIIDNLNPDEILCIPANPNEALRYCENFPIPSNLMTLARAAFTELYSELLATNYTMQEGGATINEQESKPDGEWAGGTEAQVPQEG